MHSVHCNNAQGCRVSGPESDLCLRREDRVVALCAGARHVGQAQLLGRGLYTAHDAYTHRKRRVALCGHAHAAAWAAWDLCHVVQFFTVGCTTTHTRLDRCRISQLVVRYPSCTVR